ncbi:hypothetical protein BJY00DRAFT_295724 [Aspergillus carlsbadensis]|nr:hypothetical protein BJY00DRAFT_295724 [Aspergillus carlsbadensis]
MIVAPMEPRLLAPLHVAILLAELVLITRPPSPLGGRLLQSLLADAPMQPGIPDSFARSASSELENLESGQIVLLDPGHGLIARFSFVSPRPSMIQVTRVAKRFSSAGRSIAPASRCPVPCGRALVHPLRIMGWDDSRMCRC